MIIDRLTPLQKKVVDLLVQGKTNQQIGKALRLSTNSVSKHMRNILDRSGCDSRLQVANLITIERKEAR